MTLKELILNIIRGRIVIYWEDLCETVKNSPGMTGMVASGKDIAECLEALVKDGKIKMVKYKDGEIIREIILDCSIITHLRNLDRTEYP